MSQRAEDVEVELPDRPPKRRRLELSSHAPSDVNSSGSIQRLKILAHHDYTVGWITALPLEKAAARAMVETYSCPLSNSD